MNDNNPDTLPNRVRELIATSVAGLDPADREERIAWCREHDEHGVRMIPGDDDEVLEFRWGGRRLAMIHARDLASDEPLRAEFQAAVPDTVPDDL